MEHLDTFGKRLRAARKALFEREGIELKQSVLAVRVGVTDASVSAWETGASEPDKLKVVAALARALGVTGGWLAFGEEPRYRAGNPAGEEGPESNGGKGVSKRAPPPRTAVTGPRKAPVRIPKTKGDQAG